MGLEDLQAVRRQLLKLFGRIERLGEQIDEAFAGQPFVPNLSPVAPANRRRFEAFLHEQKQVTILLGRALELWMLTCHLSGVTIGFHAIIENARPKREAAKGTAKLINGLLQPGDRRDFAKQTH